MSETFGRGSSDDPWSHGSSRAAPASPSGEPAGDSLRHARLARLHDRPVGRLSRRLRRLRARCEELARRDLSIVPNVFAPEVSASASSAPGQGRRRFQLRADRVLISLILAGGMLLPFQDATTRLGQRAPAEFASPGAQRTLYDALDTLEPGERVLVGMEYGPTAAGELDTVAGVLLRHILLRRATPVIVSRYPVTLLRAERMLVELGATGSALLQQLQREDPLLANTDWHVTRFLAGDMAGLRALTGNLATQLATDLRGAPTGLELAGLADFAQVLVVAERAEDIRLWAEQIAPLANGPLLGAVAQAATPLTRPWLEVALAGMLSGFRDALTYDTMLRRIVPPAAVPPPPPANLAARSGDAGIELTWELPPSGGGSRITGYRLRFRPGADTNRPWTEVAVTDRNYRVTNLESGTSYDFQVLAVNYFGDGAWSDAVSAIPGAEPPQKPLQGPEIESAVQIIEIQGLPADDNQVAPAVAASAGIVPGSVRDGVGILSLYRAANPDSSAVGVVSPGDALLVLLRNRVGDWLFVQTNGGLRGWLPGASLDLGGAGLEAVALQESPAPVAPLPTVTPTATAPAEEAQPGQAPRSVQSPAEEANATLPETIPQAEEREAAIHVGLALSIVLIALGALGNLGRAALGWGRR